MLHILPFWPFFRPSSPQSGKFGKILRNNLKFITASVAPRGRTASRPQASRPGAGSAPARKQRIPESDAHSGMLLGVRRAPEARHRGRATACRSDKAGVCVVRWTLTARSLLPSLRHPRPLRPSPLAPPPRNACRSARRGALRARRLEPAAERSKLGVRGSETILSLRPARHQTC